DTCPACRQLFADLLRGDDRSTVREQPLDLGDISILPRGASVGRELIHGVQGRGGMGVVYKAFDPELDRPIALKLVGFSGQGTKLGQSRVRLLREAKTLARLSHPNVVTVYDVGAYEDNLFVAMELVTGSTLRAWLDDKPRTPREILAVFHAAGAGLAAAHKLGIVHRDFKPENVMVGNDGRVRVLDFGLARWLAFRGRISISGFTDLPSASGSMGTALTRDGMVLGTPVYMAPEQDDGKPVDSRSDQYSFCAVLYEALYGKRTFAATSHSELVDQRRHEEVPPPPSLRGVSKRVRRAIIKGLRRDPDQRHRSMDALLHELGADRWTVQTKVAVAALAALALGAAGWATWVATHRAPTIEDTCALADGDVKRVWYPERKRDLQRRFTAAGLPDPTGTAERVATKVDKWTAEWSHQRTALCEMTMRADDKRSERIAEKLQCLLRRLNELDGMVSILTHTVSIDLATKADKMIDSIERPGSCELKPDVTVTAETRDRWQPYMQGLVEVHTLFGAGNQAEAIKQADDLVARARASGDQDAIGFSLELLGDALTRSTDPRAREVLLEGIRINTSLGEEGLATDGWMNMADLLIKQDNLGPEVDAALFNAELGILRLHENGDRPAKHALSRAVVHIKRLEIDAARADIDRATQLFKELGVSEHQGELALLDTFRTVVHSHAGEWQAARETMQRSLTGWKETIGERVPLYGAMVSIMGSIAAMQDHIDEADRWFAESISLIEGCDQADPSRATLLAGVLPSRAWLYARTGRCGDATAMTRRVNELASAGAKLDPDDRALTLLTDAHCQLERREPTAAIATLDHARPLVENLPYGVTLRGLIDFARARALVALGKDRARALELANQARDGLSKVPGEALRRAEVEAWIAKLAAKSSGIKPGPR
ncbi:MAG: protein kinase, partial [Kofleriaceae bacterium]